MNNNNNKQYEKIIEEALELQKQNIFNVNQSKHQYYNLRKLVGPPHLFDIKIDQPIPWKDGEWSEGITISNQGKKLELDLTKENSSIEELLMFLHYYYEVENQAFPNFEFQKIINKLLEAQSLLLVHEVRDFTRKKISNLN